MPPLRASDEDCIYKLRELDDLDVTMWRYDQLVRLGVDQSSASALALIGDSPHSVARLLGRGCSVKDAVEILL